MLAEEIILPHRLTDVFIASGTTANPDQPIAVFGALSFWCFGEHGSLRIIRSVPPAQLN
jgi:hypothetical protein